MKLQIVFLTALLSVGIVIGENKVKFTPVGEEVFTNNNYNWETYESDVLYANSGKEDINGNDNIRRTRQSDDMLVEDNHTYYLSTLYPSSSGRLDELWVDLSSNTAHTVSLSESYLKYFSIDFDIPFYGHLLPKIAITTAGFISTFESPHPYIHITQYIAPFSADFNPSQDPDSKIYYKIDGERIIVLWDKMTLNNRAELGFFTFEAIVYTNGTIQFLYKDIPALINETSSSNYTSLIGVADAFTASLLSSTVTVIYNYHRVQLGTGLRLEGSVYQLDPVPNCVTANSWESCKNISCYSSFSCGWCSEIGRCSDGFDRHRQSWVDGGCSEVGSLTCDSQQYRGLSRPILIVVVIVLALVLLAIVSLIVFIAVGVVVILRRNRNKTETPKVDKYMTM